VHLYSTILRLPGKGCVHGFVGGDHLARVCATVLSPACTTPVCVGCTSIPSHVGLSDTQQLQESSMPKQERLAHRGRPNAN
jgi:hypothetical protein